MIDSCHHFKVDILWFSLQLLVELNAPLFTENDLRQTPCELAEQASMYSIAQYLESKMVFYVR